MTTVAHPPLQTLIDDLWQVESQQVEQQTASMEALEEAMTVLDDWSQRLENQQSEQDAEQESQEQAKETEWLEAEELRKRLEHDLITARERMTDLQSSLQERTEELLKAQAANNELVAELQAANDALPLSTSHATLPVESAEPSEQAEQTEQIESDEPAEEESSPDPPEGKSVSERFGRLRKKND